MVDHAPIVAQAIAHVSKLMLVDVAQQQDVAKVLTLQRNFEAAAIVENFDPDAYMAIFQQYARAREQQRATGKRRQ